MRLRGVLRCKHQHELRWRDEWMALVCTRSLVHQALQNQEKHFYQHNLLKKAVEAVGAETCEG